MSDVSKGASRVRSVERRFHALGFRTAIVSRSGQRRGARHESLALDGDLVALAPAESRAPHFIVEVGGKSKSVRASLREMTQHALPPAFVPLVVRLVDARRKTWRWHLSSDEAFDTITGLVDAVRTGS